MNEFRVGMHVAHKISGAVGCCRYSSFGLTVVGWDVEGRWHTLGMDQQELAASWRTATNDEIIAYQKARRSHE